MTNPTTLAPGDQPGPSSALQAGLPQAVDGLTSLESLLEASGGQISPGYPELFDSRERLLTLGGRGVLAFRHDDLRRLGADPRLGNVPTEIYVPLGMLGPADDRLTDSESSEIWRFNRNQFFTAAPPVHQLTKPIFAKSLAPKAMPALAEVARRVMQGLLSDFAGRGEIEFHTQFAERACIEFWGEVLQMSGSERGALQQILADMTPIVGLDRTRQALLALNGAVPRYLDLLGEVMRRAMASGAHGYLTPIAEQYGALEDLPDGMPESLEAYMATNLIDGFHAMGVAVCTSIWSLLENPEALDAVRADRNLAPAVAGEALRLHSPVPLIQRYVREDIEYDGLEIPAQTLVVLHWNAGNHDPSVFEDPERFLPARPQRPSMTFGGGAQICPGRNLARTVAAAAVEALTAPGVRIARAGDVDWVASPPLLPRWFPDRVPVTIETSLSNTSPGATT